MTSMVGNEAVPSEIDAMDRWPELLPLLLETLQQQHIEHASLQQELRCFD